MAGVRRGSGLGDFLNKTAALLLCLLGAAVAQDDDAKKLAAAARKAERIAAQGRKLHEATKDIWKKFVFGVEYRTLRQKETFDRRQGWLGEAFWKIQRNFRLGIGYNFTDFSDNEFSQNDYSTEGWFIRVQGMY